MRRTESDDRAAMCELDTDECLVLLRWEVVGRLAVAVPGAAPSVVPVNFAVDGDDIVLRTGSGQKHDHLLGQPVSLQVDRFDWNRRIGWSVLVQGIAEECEMERLEAVGLESWAPGEKPFAVRIVPTSITGRRLDLLALPLDNRGYL